VTNVAALSDKELREHMEWAREEGNALLVSEAATELYRRYPPFTFNAGAVKEWRAKIVCPHCRKSYLRKEGDMYVHGDYGDGAIMYHTLLES